jgi:cytochrome P450
VTSIGDGSDSGFFDGNTKLILNALSSTGMPSTLAGTLAIEEFLRAYAPVTMAREVVKQTHIGGCTFKPGHMVLLSFPAANR